MKLPSSNSHLLLNLLAIELLEVIAQRRQTLSDDLVAETLDEIVDAIERVMKKIPEDAERDIIVSHLRAHSADNAVRESDGGRPFTEEPAPARPAILGGR